MKRPLGFSAEFNSQADGAPIVVLYALSSKNDKTGNMIQSSIIRSDIPPHVATVDGRDASVCFGCPLRHFYDGPCYVAEARGPLAQFKAYKNGRYVRLVFGNADHARWFNGRELRIGTYGDPVAVPVSHWRNVIAMVDGHTGYTHQWRDPVAHPYRHFLMASVDSPVERDHAHAMGWRTYRVKGHGSPVLAGEVMCPHPEKGIQCIDCLGCSGNLNGEAFPKKVDFTIDVHGFFSRSFLGKGTG